MKKSMSYFIEKAADWLFRKRSPALIIFRAGVGLLFTTLLGGIAVSAVYRGTNHFLELSYQSSHTAQQFLIIGFIIGVLITIGGTVWEYQRYQDEKKLNSKKKTIVIEQRGLVDTSDSPLNEYVKRHYPWQIDTLVTDIRERLADHEITRPDLALSKVNNLKISIAEKTAQSAPSDISIAYGGIFPVPFAFYSGYLMDDESQITIYDWDRDESNWRRLEGADDGEKLIIEPPLFTGKSVVLAVSISYPVDRQAISTVFTNLPIHYLSLSSLNRNNHWSKDKQTRLSGEFFEYCKGLLAQGVEHIHLILASQNSIAFRFGQSYDKRNLPCISVYQYERQQTVRYPWSLKVPKENAKDALIVNTELKDVA